MIVDGLTIVGSSINGYRLKAEELLASMDSNNIDKSVRVPVQPKTYRLEPQNEAIAVTQARYPDRFIGFCRVDPRQEEAITELRRCVLQFGLKGLLLHPIEEGYTINEDYAVRLMKEAGSFGVPVIVAAGYPWVAHALQIRSVAEQAEEATIIHGLPRLPRVFALLRTLLLIGLMPAHGYDSLAQEVQFGTTTWRVGIEAG